MTNEELCIKLSKYFKKQMPDIDTIDEQDEIIYSILYTISLELIDNSKNLDSFESDNY